MLHFILILLIASTSIIELSDQNYTEILKEYKQNRYNVIVKVYLIGCGHCVRFAPIYEETEYINSQDADSRTVFAQFREETEKSLFSQRYGVKGYPTVLIFKYDTEMPEEYGDERSVETLLGYTRWIRSSAPVHLTKESELTQRMKNATLPFELHVGNSAIDTSRLSGLRQYNMEKYKNLSGIYLVRSKALASPREQLMPVESDSSIKKIMANTVGLCADIKSYFPAGSIVATLIIDTELTYNQPLVRYASNRLRMLQAKFSNIHYCIQKYEEANPFLRVSFNHNHFSTLAIKDNKGKYLMSKDPLESSTFDMSASEEFIQNYLNGKAEPYVWSEPLPQFNNVSNIKLIVGRTYDSFIKNTKANVFVRIYKELGYSPELQEFWYNLYEEVSAKKIKVVMADIETDFNELPEEIYKKYGNQNLFLLYLKDVKEPILFNSRAKNTTTMVEFLESNIH